MEFSSPFSLLLVATQPSTRQQILEPLLHPSPEYMYRGSVQALRTPNAVDIAFCGVVFELLAHHKATEGISIQLWSLMDCIIHRSLDLMRELNFRLNETPIEEREAFWKYQDAQTKRYVRIREELKRVKSDKDKLDFLSWVTSGAM